MKLSEEQKYILRQLSKYIKSFGMKYGTIVIESDYFSNLDGYFKEGVHFHNNWSVSFPEFALSTLEDIVKRISNTPALDDLNKDSLNYDNLNIEIHTDTMMIEVSREYGYEDIGDSSGITWGDETDDDEMVESLISEIRASDASISSEGIVRLDYTGGGDSGYIDNSFDGGGRVPSLIEDWCYGRLEENFGGWEINEGSQGFFTFDLNNNIIELEHTYNEEVNETDEILFVTFGKSA